MKRLPDFIIAGAQKSGTTWIVDVLRQHPDVFIPRDEIHYFNDSYDKGIEWYGEHFKEASINQIIGEKTPDYFGQDYARLSDDGISSRIKHDLPEVKVILVLRNPIDRAVSAFNHYVRMRVIPPYVSFDSYILGERYIKDGLGIVDYGYYDKYLKEYTKLFGKEKIHVIYYEELFKDKGSAIQKLLMFLDLKPLEFQTNFHSNAFNKSEVGLYINYYLPILNKIGWQFDKIFPNAKRKPSDKTLKVLQSIYTPTVVEMESLMGFVPDKWKASILK